MKNSNTNTFVKYLPLILLVVCSGMLFAGCSSQMAIEDNHNDSHAGHNHDSHAEEQEIDVHSDDEHQGHDDEHKGHDHETDNDAHEEDSHDEHSEMVEEPHEGHDHDEQLSSESDPHEGHDHSSDSGLIELTDEQKRRIGLELAVAERSEMNNTRMFPGEVIENPDRIAHVVAQAEGIVREIKKSLGDYVKDGDVLAWIESAELGDAKTEYLEKKQQLELARSDYARESKIYENTLHLLTLLKNLPELSELEKIHDLDMGMNKGEIIAAYTEYVYAKDIYELEKDLFEKEITSRNEFLEAETAFRKAEADFHAVRDETAFSSERSHFELKKAQEIAELSLNTSERKLHLLGLSESDIISLSNGSKSHAKMSYYPIKSPFAGYVTEKHLALGEKISSDDNIFTISDVSSVWVKFNVYQKDLDHVKQGFPVTVNTDNDDSSYHGVIDFVSPTIDRETRTVQAIITLDNRKGDLRPGLYVKVLVDSDSENSGIIVPAVAVQMIDEEPVVFVESGDGFAATPVTLGSEINGNVFIKSGLKPGQRYVVNGAFELKAKIITSNLDPHAGHGH